LQKVVEKLSKIFPQLFSTMEISRLINDLLDSNPALKSFPIRVDDESKKASVIDIISMISGHDKQTASKTCKNLTNELTEKIINIKINGKGKETPVADAPTLVEIVWALPGKAALQFKRQSAHYICRILGGDVSLAVEIEERFKTTAPEVKEFMTAHVVRETMSPKAEAEVVRRTAELQKTMIDGREYTLPDDFMSQAMKQEFEANIISALRNQRENDHKRFKQEESEHHLKRARMIQESLDLTQYMHPSQAIAVRDRINSLVSQGSGLMLVGDVADKPSWLPEFSQLLEDMNIKYDNSLLSKLGTKIAKTFKKRYPDKEIEKVDKHVNGAVRKVNVYQEKEREWILDLIRDELRI
jgi:hypothetical protein